MAPPSGVRIELAQMHWYRVRDGQLVEHWAVRDDLSAGRQLASSRSRTRR